MIWLTVIGGSLACYLEKFAGTLVPARHLEHPLARRITGLLPVAMLAALVAVQAFATGTTLAVDARIAGLLAAAVALVLRAPFLLVVFVAAAVAAGLRALGLAT